MSPSFPLKSQENDDKGIKRDSTHKDKENRRGNSTGLDISRRWWGSNSSLGGVSGLAGSCQIEVFSGPREASTLDEQNSGESVTVCTLSGWTLGPLLTLPRQTGTPTGSSSWNPSDQAWCSSLPRVGNGRLLLQKTKGAKRKDPRMQTCKKMKPNTSSLEVVETRHVGGWDSQRLPVKLLRTLCHCKLGQLVGESSQRFLRIAAACNSGALGQGVQVSALLTFWAATLTSILTTHSSSSNPQASP